MMIRKKQNVGYKRMSLIDTDIDIQLDGIKLDRIFKDKISGLDENRLGLKKCRAYLMKGDTLFIDSMFRLARSLNEFKHIVTELLSKGIKIKFIKEELTFSGSATNKKNRTILDTMEILYKLNGSKIKDHNKKRKTGIKPKLNDKQVKEMIAIIEKGVNRKSVAKHFKISRQTLYVTLKRNGLKIQCTG